jgi:predicted transposase YbfD/YdcC
MLSSFPLKDMIITLDALHCQTKTAKAIKESGNEYLMQAKNNQKNS